MTTTLVNLTPHPLNLGATVLPASGTVARVTTTPGALTVVEGLPVPVKGAATFGGVVGLPEPTEGTFFVVSGLVGSALVAAGLSRPDVLMPGTGPDDNAVRNEKGHVVGVTCLVRATN